MGLPMMMRVTLLRRAYVSSASDTRSPVSRVTLPPSDSATRRCASRRSRSASLIMSSAVDST
ncbi:MAG: hypothetical protein IPG81_18915 [Sandaracinaceae bacterium]|nr:hypothetical protein [Sandaracinaceae bacterium]